MAVTDEEWLTDALNERFKQNGFDSDIPNVVFWMDPSRDFVDMVDRLRLDGVTVLKWDGFNSFMIKREVELCTEETRFLIYTPFDPLPDESNILADMMHYSEPHFRADKASIYCMELGLPDTFRELVSDHISFFKYVDNRRGFSRFQSRDSEEEAIGSIMAVLVKAEDSSMESILQAMIERYASDPCTEKAIDIIHPFDVHKLTDAFWSRCSREFGFSGRSIEELVRDLLFTAAFYDSEIGRTVEPLSKHILPKGPRAIAFINRLQRDKIEALCTSVSEKFGIRSILEKVDSIDDLLECGVFDCVDSIVVSRLMDAILSTRAPLDARRTESIASRIGSKPSMRPKPWYEAILSASDIVDRCGLFESTFPQCTDAESIIEGYVSQWHLIDASYRRFNLAFDSILYDSGIDEGLRNRFRNHIEIVYCESFLRPVTDGLCSRISSYRDLPGPYQQDFCQDFLEKDSRKTAVIISDGFRYECAAELRDRLSATSRVRECRLKHMVSTVPSDTCFGMAALLPNKGLKVRMGDNVSVLIDYRRTDSENRESILQSAYPDSVVLKYEVFGKVSSKELRARCSGKKVVYIYHDRVDHVGENDEGRTFKACEETISEIVELITTLTNWSFVRFVVTADHGFIYRHSDVPEYDRISTEQAFYSQRRSAVNDRPWNLESCLEFPLDYLGEGNEGLFVSVPKSISVFRHQGKTKRYLHEGISPQEIVVPVLEVDTIRGSITERYVGLKPEMTDHIKQYNPRFRLWQDHPVDDEYRKGEYTVWLEDKDGQRISQEYLVIADKTDKTDLGHQLPMKEQLSVDTVRLIIRNNLEPSEERRSFEFRVRIISDII